MDLFFCICRIQIITESDKIPSLTVWKSKNRCTPCIYWGVAIFAVVTIYSNLFSPFTLFLNCFFIFLSMRTASVFSIIQLPDSRSVHLSSFICRVQIITESDKIPSLTLWKRKNRCTPCIYWSVEIFAVVTEYSNLFSPFTFFLDSSSFFFLWGLQVIFLWFNYQTPVLCISLLSFAKFS